MIYKDLFKIKINGKEYVEEDGVVPKKTFTLQEMRNIYLDNQCRDFEIEYVPILTTDILSDEEIYGWSEHDNDYDYDSGCDEEGEDYD